MIPEVLQGLRSSAALSGIYGSVFATTDHSVAD
jgi:hypothetical protein